MSLSRLGVDIVAGLTVASVLVPQSISYATSLARLSPVVGLVRFLFFFGSFPCLEKRNLTASVQFSASIPGIVYAVLGTSRQLNVAPEAALSLVVGQAVSDVLHRTAPSPDPVEHDKIGLAVSTIITLQVRSSLTSAEHHFPAS
jgi:MFS superfamily sulfate permease-like transporter